MTPGDVKFKDFNEEEMAEFTGYSIRTLRTYRSEGNPKVPPSYKRGKYWIYPGEEVQKWDMKRKKLAGVA